MKSRARYSLDGFTLIELMVAIAILAIIVVAVAQIIGTTSALTTVNDKHMDANDQARTVFDRMANDFSRMIKRNDVDYIFCKAAGNDTMFFFTSGASYFDTATSFNQFSTGYTTYPPEKNPVSLVGYRINNGTELGSHGPTYYQMERLGRALSWDATPSINPVVFLTYPTPGLDAATVDSTTGNSAPNGYYSTAYFSSTLWGAYSNGSGATSIVGTLANNFNDGVDDTATANANPYHVLATQVFRFEYSFQLKDGTQSVIPVMTPSASNGLPALVSAGDLTATSPPTHTTDGSKGYKINSRYYDASDHIGYICVDNTTGYAQWKEIGLRDIAAIVVNLAIIDKQGLVYVKNSGIDMSKLAGALADATSPNYSSIANTWTTAITPAGAGAKSAASTASGLPQEMVSQVRIYQRFFYLNNL